MIFHEFHHIFQLLLLKSYRFLVSERGLFIEK